MPVPPPDEQKLIVRFLDWHGAQTAKLMRAKRKLLALLNEQKQAIIHRAVTRGLNPNVKLKPLGVPWLGDVPEGWEIKKLRQCGRILGGMTPSMERRELWDGDIPWVTPKDMKVDALTDARTRVSERALVETSLRMVPAGSVLLVVRGMILARRVPVARTLREMTINQDMKAIIPSSGITPAFLHARLQAAQEIFAPLIDEAGHGTRRFPTERWRNVVFAFPREDEQRQITDWIAAHSAEQQNSIKKVEREIALLQEFRTRLIADVVTGKLDVRAVAATLPETLEPASDDEPDDAGLEEGEDAPEDEEAAA